MKRISIVLCVVALSLGACNKPSEDSCRKALANMRALLGTDVADANVDLAGDVRRCKGGSSKKAVECAIKATTLDELRACEFMKVPEKKAGSADAGSAAAGSAGAGSAAAGSAGSTDTGSAGSAAIGSAGSAGSAAAGSAGSANSGSAAAGSATGSADGAAATGSGAASGSAASGSAGATP